MGPWKGKSRVGQEGKVIRTKKGTKRDKATENKTNGAADKQGSIRIQKKNMMPTYWPIIFCPYTYFVNQRPLSSNLTTGKIK